MYQPINGWTKQKILDVIRARPFEDRAMDNDGNCVYLAPDGNKCAVGLFIPDGHDGLTYKGSIYELLKACPDLYTYMPLNVGGMDTLQLTHDGDNEVYEGSRFTCKAAMIDWVEKHVED